MSSERSAVASKSLYLRTVPDRREHLDHRDFDSSDRSGFANSTIDREAYLFADRPNARDFETLLAAYLWSGGVARGQEVIVQLDAAGLKGPESLAKLMASKAVFGFEWRGSLWLPMFQFEQPGMSVKPPSRKVLSALAGVFDGWSMAAWYVQRNSWLDGRRPVDLLDRHPSAVLGAARGDRFIATNSLLIQ